MVNMVQMFTQDPAQLQAEAARQQVAIALANQQGGQGTQQGFDGMNQLAQAYGKRAFMKGAPKTYDMNGLPSDAFSGGVPNAGVAGSNGLTEFGAGDLSALGPTGGSGALTEFGAGDLSALGGGAPTAGGAAGGGAGAVAGGLGAGAGAMVALAMFNNYFRQHHEMTAQDYLKQWAGQSAKDKDLAAQYGASGNTAGQNQYTALSNTNQGLMNLTNSALAGNYVPNVTTVRDPGYQRNAKVF